MIIINGMSGIWFSALSLIVVVAPLVSLICKPLSVSAKSHGVAWVFEYLFFAFVCHRCKLGNTISYVGKMADGIVCRTVNIRSFINVFSSASRRFVAMRLPFT